MNNTKYIYNAIFLIIPFLEKSVEVHFIEFVLELSFPTGFGNFDSGIITDITKNKQFKGQPFPEFMQKIIDCEGLVNYINSGKN